MNNGVTQCADPDTCAGMVCVCPNGTVENYEGECVEPGQCECLYLEDGNHYQQGEVVPTDNPECEEWCAL